MIDSPMGMMETANRLSIPEIQKSIQDGVLPAYIGVPILQAKIQQAQQAKQAAVAQGNPQAANMPTIEQQVMQQARGLHALAPPQFQPQAPGTIPQPAPMQPYGIGGNPPIAGERPEGMAHGGMVAFAGDDGSYVDLPEHGYKKFELFTPEQPEHGGLAVSDGTTTPAQPESSASVEDSPGYKWAAENARGMRRGLNSAEATEYLADEANFQKALQEARNRPIDPYTGRPITNGGIRSLGEFLPNVSRVLNNPVIKGAGKALGAAGAVGMGSAASDLAGNLPAMLSGRGGLESLPAPIRNTLLTGSAVDPGLKEGLQKAGAYAAGLFAPTDEEPQASPSAPPSVPPAAPSVPPTGIPPTAPPSVPPTGIPPTAPPSVPPTGIPPAQPDTTTVFPDRMTIPEVAAAIKSGKMTDADVAGLQKAGLIITEAPHNPPVPSGQGYQPRMPVYTPSGQGYLGRDQASVATPQSRVLASPAPETPPAPAKSLADYQTEYAKLAGADSGIGSLADSLKAAQGDISEDKRRAPWLALMKAGLATMAGKSPWAMVNIGEGAKEGMDEYSRLQHDVHAATAQQFALKSQWAHAKRQEELAGLQYGIHSVEADKARQAAAEIAAQHNAMSMNIARMTDATHRYGYDQTYNTAILNNNTQRGIAQLNVGAAQNRQPYQYEPANQAKGMFDIEAGILKNLMENFADPSEIAAQQSRTDAAREVWHKLANVPTIEAPQPDFSGFTLKGKH